MTELKKNSPIIKRIYYKIDVESLSPLAISNGDSDLTDSDIIRNASGDCFVPGTSLAGAFRNALMLDKKTDGIMGYSDGENGRMSSIYISDMDLAKKDGKVITSVRDGIRLGDDHLVADKGKYDMEIIETGVTGSIYINCLIRQGSDERRYLDAIKNVIFKIHSGDIRLGANKNRGFGRFKVLDINISEFTKDNLQQYLEFKNCFKDAGVSYDKRLSYDEWSKENGQIESGYVWMEVPLKLTGGISIRRYSTEPGKADYSHMTCNDKPVIPGTSWNGAIRSGVLEILKELGTGTEYANHIIDEWFGSIKKKEEGHQSNIIIGESIIEGARKLTMTRNKINRFDASTVDGALYTEISYFGGITALNIGVKKDAKDDYLAIIAMLELVCQAIADGLIAVGGQTAVGRGIFASNGNIIYSEDVAGDRSAALYNLIKGGANR